VTAAVACPECGSQVFTEDRFCGACGTPVTVTLSSNHAAKLLNELRASTAGEYEIRGEIGRGGMAVVYLAYDLRLNRKVAIKAMLPDLAFHDGMEERFKREARTAARLDHPNIVVIYSVRDAGDPLFFVMKYVDGAPLDAIIRRHGALPIAVVQGILQQLCAALQYAHSDGVVHRDVKPANVLVDSRGNVQVTDFGIAKAADSVHLTRTGMAIGTPTYMCPEQCTGHPQSAASDQYSVGIVAYELLTGRPPFTGAAIEIQWAHLKDEPTPLATIRPDCPPALAAAVMRMLSKDPKDRWPSLRDAIPLIATGAPVDPEAGRLALAELVRTSPPTRQSLIVTPLSPVPAKVEPPRRAAPGAQTPTPAHMAAPVTPVASTPPITPPTIVALEVTPRQCSVEIGTTERIRARVRDSLGRELEGKPEWSSSNPVIASVDDAGVVTAHSIGAVTIAAMVGSVASMVNVEVIQATVARVDVEPNVVSVREHGVVRLTVRAYTARAKQIVSIPPRFTSADPSIADFDEHGNIQGHEPGSTTATVTVGGVETRLIITVTPGLTREFAGVPAEPKRLPVKPIAIAAGVLVAALGGWWAVSRTSSGERPIESTASAGAVATPPAPAPAVPPVPPPNAAPVAPPPVAAKIPADTVVAALELTDPSPVAIDVGETKMLVAKVTNKRGELLPTARVGWESSSPAIATVDNEGVLIAAAPGRALVTAKVGERTRVLAVDVRASLVSKVTVSVAKDSLQPGESTNATAQVFDRRNSALQETVTWRSSNPAVASVDEGGVVRASGTGRTLISASSGGVADSVQVVVATGASAEPAAPPAARTSPNDAESQAIVDSVVTMIERQTVRLSQLVKNAGDAGANFQKFLETNNPSAKLAGAAAASAQSPGAKVAAGVVLQWEKTESQARREKTVNVEVLVEPVKGGWAIRELRFPSGFTP